LLGFHWCVQLVGIGNAAARDRLSNSQLEHRTSDV
jgi:hypothetical protein